MSTKKYDKQKPEKEKVCERSADHDYSNKSFGTHICSFYADNTGEDPLSLFMSCLWLP